MKKASIAFLVLLIPIWVFCWTTPVNVSNTPQKSNVPAIAVDRFGHPHVAWSDFQNHPVTVPPEILHCYFNGTTWSDTMNISRDLTYSWYPSLTVDSSGTPYILWEDWGIGGVGRCKIYFSYFTGDSFTLPISISDSLHPSLPFARMGDIVIDSQNRVNIVWSDESSEDFEVYYSMKDENNWSNPINVSQSPGIASGFPKMCIDKENNIHVVWRENVSLEAEIYYSKFNGVTWTVPVNISNLYGHSDEVEVSADTSGYPHIVWQQSYQAFQIYYSFFDGRVWSTPFSLDSLSGFKGYLPDIAVDRNNYVHAVWRKTSANILYAYKNGLVWSIPTPITEHLSALPSLVADDSNNIHAVWVEATIGDDTTDIFYSKNESTGINLRKEPVISEKVIVYPNFPNPFFDTTKIEYYLTEGKIVKIIISNVSGQIIKKINLGYQIKGFHNFLITKDMLIQESATCGNIYFCLINTENKTVVRKMVLIK